MFYRGLKYIIRYNYIVVQTKYFLLAIWVCDFS